MTTGCGKSNRPPDLPKLYPCTLTFKQDGKPLEDANIILQSKDAAFKWAVGGTTDAQGVVKIVTHGQFFGAPLGKYSIVISKTVSEKKGGAANIPEGVDPASIMNAGGGMLSVYTFVEKKYADAVTTPLEIEIDKSKNDREFDCGKPVKELLRMVAP